MEHIYIGLDVYMFDINKKMIYVKKPKLNMRVFEVWELYMLLSQGILNKDVVNEMYRWALQVKKGE